MKCLNHNDREAIALCIYCKQPICNDCSIKINDKIMCEKRCQDTHLYNDILSKLTKKISNQSIILISSFKCCFLSSSFLLISNNLISESKFLKSNELHNMGIFAGVIGVLIFVIFLLIFINRLKAD